MRRVLLQRPVTNSYEDGRREGACKIYWRFN